MDIPNEYLVHLKRLIESELHPLIVNVSVDTNNNKINNTILYMDINVNFHGLPVRLKETIHLENDNINLRDMQMQDCIAKNIRDMFIKLFQQEIIKDVERKIGKYVE